MTASAASAASAASSTSTTVPPPERDTIGALLATDQLLERLMNERIEVEPERLRSGSIRRDGRAGGIGCTATPSATWQG